MKCRSEDVPALEGWLSDGRYRSPVVISEMIQLMAFQVIRQVLADVQSAKWYSIIADKTRDVSGKEQ